MAPVSEDEASGELLRAKQPVLFEGETFGHIQLEWDMRASDDLISRNVSTLRWIRRSSSSASAKTGCIAIGSCRLNRIYTLYIRRFEG